MSQAATDVPIAVAALVDDISAVQSVLDEIDPSSYTLPNHDSKIYKDECMYCYHTPYHEGGLFICLKTLTAFCSTHMKMVAEKRDRRLYLQLTSKRNIQEECEEPKDKIKRLAIGVEQGFCNENVEVEDEYALVVFPQLDTRIPITLISHIPIGTACERIASTTSAERLELLQGASNAWDGEMKQVTKHVDLQQVDNPRDVGMSGWKCDVPTCELAENLWLNLTDGSIRCGRSQFISDGVRSKGNNHMKMYYDEKGFPLVVKLGTIEENGTADVYSYDEDEAVIDPNLEKHLAHFGINMKELKKTEKSTIELELDINQKWEWARCQEDGENLETVYGPFYTGLINIGSSCYINSVVQTLLCVPDFVDRFVGGAAAIMESVEPCEMGESLLGQTAKLFSSIASGQFSRPPPNEKNNGIKPTQFRKIMGRGHPEFSSARQQDAEEYIRHLLDKVSGAMAGEEAGDPSTALRFKQQVRMLDNASGRVRYSEREEVVLSVPVPERHLAPVDNEARRFEISLQDCLNEAFGDVSIDDFRSPVTGEQKGAVTRTSMVTFPDFLIIQVQRFSVNADYTVKKLDVDVLVEDEVDLGKFRGSGVQPGEELLPDEDAPALPPFNEDIAGQIEGMGFTRNAAIRACIATKNGGTEAAVEWVMQHMDDDDINQPLQAPKAAASTASTNDVEQLVSFGFTATQARFALQREGEVNAAAEWLFVHASEVPEEEPAAPPPTNTPPKQFRDGKTTYRLEAFISHMGSSPHSGHYVCHILRDGRWVLFNDEKVALSKNPPKQLAYLYMYRRVNL